MQGLIPTRLTHFVLEDGSVRPFLVVAVLPANTPTQDDPCGAYDKGIVNGILFRDGLNDTTATAHQEEKHSAPLMEWLSGVRFDSNSVPGTWHFTQGAPQPVTANGVQPPDFIGKIMDRVQDLLNDHAESIKKMLDEAGARNVEMPPVAIAPEKHHPKVEEWSPDLPYKSGDRVTYLSKEWLSLADSTGVVPGSDGAETFWQQVVHASPGLQENLQAESGPLAHEVGNSNELDTSGELRQLAEDEGRIITPAVIGKDPWTQEKSYRAGDRVAYEGKDYVAVVPSQGVTPGVRPAEGMVSAMSWAELKALPEWSKEEMYRVGSKVKYQGAEYIATRSSVDFAPGSEDAKGYWSPISGALHAFLESGGGFGSNQAGSAPYETAGSDAVSKLEDAMQGTAGEQK